MIKRIVPIAAALLVSACAGSRVDRVPPLN